MKNDFGFDIAFHNDYTATVEEKKVQLLYVLEGIVKAKIGDDRFTLRRDDVIVINSGQKYEWKQEKDSLVCVIFISNDLLYQETGHNRVYFWCNSAVDKDTDYKELRNVIGNLMAEYALDIEHLNLKKRAFFYQLLDLLLNRYTMESSHPADHMVEDSQFSEVLKYIQDHYNQPLSLGDAAAQVYMNDSSFSRYFKKNAGINFLEYLNNLRLQNALEELLHTRKSLTAIALDNGFTNSSMFSKAFKKAYGKSPTEYKKNRGPYKYEEITEKVPEGNSRYRDQLSRLVDENRNQNQNEIFRRKAIVNVSSQSVYRKVWNQAINAGFAVDLELGKMQKLLPAMKDELGFTYVRLVNVFSWEMHIRKDRNSKNLNFEQLDNVLDFLVSNGMKPMLDFGDKPRRIFLDSNEIVQIEDEPIFQSIQESRWMVNSFLQHITQRYGVSEVESWIFDLWNDLRAERNSGYLYLEVFDMCSTIIKSYAPAAKVGGCCMELGADNRELITCWFQEHVKPDFLSLAAFPYKRELPGFDQRGRRITDPHFLYHELQRFRSMLNDCNIHGVPIMLSEWNLSMSDRNYYNDSCGKAAQMLMNMTECLELVDMANYLFATDLNIRYYDTATEFFGGTGLLNKEGLAKPAYYALKYMNQLGPILVQKGDGYMVTADIKGNYYILMFNHKKFNYSYYTKPENEISVEDLPNLYADMDPVELELELSGIANGEYRIKTTTLGVDNGSVLSSWKSIGYDWVMNQEEQDYLRRISVPRISVRRQQAKNGKMTISERLEAHDIRFIKIFK